MKRGAGLLFLALSGSPLFLGAIEETHTETAVTRTDSAGIDRFNPKRARLFELNDSEWQRYRILMSGPRGLWSPNLDPIWVLGIHSETEAEREHYAEIAAQREHDRVTQELAFERAYQQAFAKLYPTERVGDLTQLLLRRNLKTNDHGANLQAGDRIALFARPECEECDRVLKDLLPKAMRAGIALDIYLADAASNDAIRTWATARHIRPEWVRDRKVTLNHDQGRLEALAPDGKAPYLLRDRGGEQVPISPLDLLMLH